MFIEMSKDPDHGGEGWEFGSCLWAPTAKEAGGRWPFWSKVGDVKKGELILHLRGVHRETAFVGVSVAASDGYITSERPPILGQWGFSKSFFRADLENYNAFPTPISLKGIFQTKEKELRHYFQENKDPSTGIKKNLFYVVQSNRLQCQNGAYLSDLDDILGTMLLGSDFLGDSSDRPLFISVTTGLRIQEIFSRVGQAEFSKQVKVNYNLRCCFPNCTIDDPTFLIGAHIARWADNESFRGRIDNGLCFCLMHDRAFEEGYFTINNNFCVVPIPPKLDSGYYLKAIARFSNCPIFAAPVPPSIASLQEHWRRHNYQPLAVPS